MSVGKLSEIIHPLLGIGRFILEKNLTDVVCVRKPLGTSLP